MTFDDYYRDVYLPLHTKTSTRICHLIGVLVTLVWLSGVVLTPLWWSKLLVLLLAPVVVYPFAWFGHFVFENNKPAAWTNPWWAKLSDFRMCYDLLMGRLP